MISVSKQIQQLEKKLNKFSKVDVPRAHSSALNKTMAKAKTQIIRATSKEAKVKQAIIRKRVFVKKSTPKTQRGKLSGYTRSIPLMALNPVSKVKRDRKTGRYQNLGIKAGGRSFPNVFVQNIGRKKTPQFLQRISRARYPLEVPKVIIEGSLEDNAINLTRNLIASEYRRLVVADLNFRIIKYGRT